GMAANGEKFYHTESKTKSPNGFSPPSAPTTADDGRPVINRQSPVSDSPSRPTPHASGTDDQAPITNHRSPASTEPAAEEPRSVIDTSKMSTGQRAALELTEAAREVTREPTLASGLFMGSLNLGQGFP